MTKHLHTIISTILLWLIGLIAVSLIKGITIGSDLKSNALYIAEMDANALPGQKITAESLLKDIKGIDASSIEIIPKEQAAEMMLSDLPALSNSGNDLFRDIITFKLDRSTDADVDVVRRQVVGIDGVTGFYYEEEIFSGIHSGIGRFRLALIGLALVLLAAVIMVILYALRQAFTLKKDHVVAMFLAGTTPDILMKPYLLSATKKAIRVGLIAIVILAINIVLINRMLLQGIEVSILQGVLASLIVMLVSVATYYGTTYTTALSFLKQFKISI